MAGEWIKVTLDLPDKPEVHYIANALNLDPDAVVGKLIRVWAWFDKNTRDGNAFGVTFALLDRITSVTGFGEVMSLAGWMEQRDKVLVMPNFERHNAESSKKRALTAKRVQKYRNAPSVTQALPEKRREEKNITPKSSRSPIGSRLQEDVLPNEWAEFARKERPDLQVVVVFEGFRDYWIAQPGNRGVKADWFATWRNWVRNQKSIGGGNGKGKFSAIQYNAQQLAKSMGASSVPETVVDVHGEIQPFLPGSGNDR